MHGIAPFFGRLWTQAFTIYLSYINHISTKMIFSRLPWSRYFRLGREPLSWRWWAAAARYGSLPPCPGACSPQRGCSLACRQDLCTRASILHILYITGIARYVYGSSFSKHGFSSLNSLFIYSTYWLLPFNWMTTQTRLNRPYLSIKRTSLIINLPIFLRIWSLVILFFVARFLVEDVRICLR